jgi:hypothetical protein
MLRRASYVCEGLGLNRGLERGGMMVLFGVSAETISWFHVGCLFARFLCACRRG